MKIISYALISAGIWWIALWIAILGILQNNLNDVVQAGEYQSSISAGIAGAIVFGGLHIAAGIIIDRKRLDSQRFEKIAGIRRFNFVLIVAGVVWLLVAGVPNASSVWEFYSRDEVSLTSTLIPIAAIVGFGVMLIIAAVQQHAKDRKFSRSEARNASGV